ncbi:hypothetical protein EDB19DRAFT_1907642 [Suillus lakei]|nr:hypothetical protein EDB19DRAFT_1907642 [Suillus lakei]
MSQARVAHTHEPETIIHFVEYPYGYYLPIPQGNDQSVDDSSILQTTWIGSSAMISVAGTGTHRRCKKTELAEHSLHRVMETCPNWRKALAYLRILLRIAICRGHSDNPHILVTADYADRRRELLNSWWPKSLICANAMQENLETVLAKDTQVPMSENAVVVLALLWITQFLYDNRRLVTYSMDDSRMFGLGNFFGLAQRQCILTFLEMFTHPHAHLLPLSMSPINSLSLSQMTYFTQQVNKFYKFLHHQMAKELIYHIIFRTTATCHIRLTIADVEPMTFRTATNPPVDTLALVGSCCYQVLLARLVLIWGKIDPMPNYPTASQVHTKLRGTSTVAQKTVRMFALF